MKKFLFLCVCASVCLFLKWEGKKKKRKKKSRKSFATSPVTNLLGRSGAGHRTAQRPPPRRHHLLQALPCRGSLAPNQCTEVRDNPCYDHPDPQGLLWFDLLAGMQKTPFYLSKTSITSGLAALGGFVSIQENGRHPTERI